MILKLVYGVLSTDRITGPVLFEDKVNTERQIEQIHHPFFEWLASHERQHAFFQQQYYTTAYTLRASMDALRKEFGNRIIDSGL
jgi:hypothetical protein